MARRVESWLGHFLDEEFDIGNPIRVQARVSALKCVGDGIYVVDFDVPAHYNRFTAGQFLHLTLDDFDPTSGYWPESRVFSIASEPKQAGLTIIYSVKGAYTRRMEKELVQGSLVWLKFPYGNFTIGKQLSQSSPVVLVAGGTGVSPFWPYLKGKKDPEGEIHLYYGIRRPEHMLFGEELKVLQQQPWFNLHLVVEAGEIRDFPFARGSLSVERIKSELKQGFERAHFYLSGPPLMIRTFKSEILGIGVHSDQVHIDEWE